MTETRTLKAHDKLLIDVIKKQAGVLEKAMLEATMNSIEADSSRVDIDFSVDGDGKARMIISDDGKGIVTKAELEAHFEKFGTPHEASENKTWAQFRMGRGQLFAFGHNVWRTSTFEMDVDIETEPALEWGLKEGLSAVEGTTITIDLYENPIGSWQCRSIEALKSNIRKQIEFMEVPIYFNGEQINTPASQLTWDAETVDAYFSFGVGSVLSIYNLGAFVKDIAASTAGVVGVVVSKEMLDVNFARNDVQNTCEIYKRIQEVIKENRIKKTRKSSVRLNQSERIAVLHDIRDGEISWKDASKLSLFETSTGKVLSLDAISRFLVWSFAKSGSQVADKLMQVGNATCIDSAILDVLSYRGDEGQFFNWLLINMYAEKDNWHAEGKMSKSAFHRMQSLPKLYRPFAELKVGFREDHRILSEDLWTKTEKRVIRVLSSYNCWNGRRIVIGLSDTANGWTDGYSYIAIGRDFLKSLYLGCDGGVSDLITFMFHELAHNDSTENSHVHGLEFYKAYHDLTRHGGLWMISNFYSRVKNLKQEDYTAEIIAREEKARARRDKKLGLSIAAESKSSVVKPKAPAKAKVVVVKRSKARRRKTL